MEKYKVEISEETKHVLSQVRFIYDMASDFDKKYLIEHDLNSPIKKDILQIIYSLVLIKDSEGNYLLNEI